MFDVEQITSTGGLIGILLVSAIVFAESGILIGFFLPGDTLLFAAGLAASQGTLSLPLLIFGIVTAAILGDNVGYSIGRRMGPRLFKKKDGIIFRQEYIQQAEKFYESHGGKTIILARFTPIVRTFAPVVAGASKMPREKFFFYNVIGGVIWGCGLPLLGYLIGDSIPQLSHYIDYIIIAVMVLSVLIAFKHLFQDADTRKKIFAVIKSKLSTIFLNKKID